MKILSLQSVGLGTFYVERAIDESVYAPYCICVGGYVDNLRGGYEIDKNRNEITVTKIEFGDMYAGKDIPIQYNTYFAHTSDGHIRVLPAGKYIAEWGE